MTDFDPGAAGAPTRDTASNSNRVSIYGTNAAAGDTALALTAAGRQLADVQLVAPLTDHASTTGGAAASAACSLTAAAGRRVYVSGFTITGAAVVAAVNGLATLTGLVNAAAAATTLSYVVNETVAGGTFVQVVFHQPLRSAVNGTVTLTCPAIVGGAAITVNLQGFQA